MLTVGRLTLEDSLNVLAAAAAAAVNCEYDANRTASSPPLDRRR